MDNIEGQSRDQIQSGLKILDRHIQNLTDILNCHAICEWRRYSQAFSFWDKAKTLLGFTDDYYYVPKHSIECAFSDIVRRQEFNTEYHVISKKYE